MLEQDLKKKILKERKQFPWEFNIDNFEPILLIKTNREQRENIKDKLFTFRANTPLT